MSLNTKQYKSNHLKDTSIVGKKGENGKLDKDGFLIEVTSDVMIEDLLKSGAIVDVLHINKEDDEDNNPDPIIPNEDDLITPSENEENSDSDETKDEKIDEEIVNPIESEVNTDTIIPENDDKPVKWTKTRIHNLTREEVEELCNEINVPYDEGAIGKTKALLTDTLVG